MHRKICIFNVYQINNPIDIQNVSVLKAKIIGLKIKFMPQDFSTEWTTLQRIIFRFIFCYFILFLVFFTGQAFPIWMIRFLDFINEFLQNIYNASIGWIASIFLKQEIRQFRNGGDNLFNNVAVVTFLTLSLIGTIVWSAISKNKSHEKLSRIFFTALRYYLAILMFDYGLAKVFGIQFRYPAPGDLLKPLGDHIPYTLLWRFMGYSKLYCIITGSVEILGGVLLLFRKTTMLGAVLTFGALCNVFILNVSYGIDVKLFSLNLLIIAVVLMTPNLKNIYDFIILHKSSFIPVMQPAFDWQKRRFFPKILKIFFLCYLGYNALSRPIKFLPQLAAMKSAFYGAYQVEDFILNGISLPPLTTDTIRWKKMIVDNKWGVLVQYMSDSTKWYSGTIDTVSKSVELKDPEDTSFKSKFFYVSTQPQKYMFKEIWRNDSIVVNLQKMDLNQFRLVKSKRPWIVH